MKPSILKTSVFLIAALTAVPALAQPTPAQTSAIKSNCRSDYMKSCMSVPTGGQAAFDCLKRNMASLSPACQQAVNAINPPAAPKPAAAAPSVAPAPAPAAPAPTPAAVTPPPAAPAPAPTLAAAPAAAPVATPAPVPAPVATAPAAKPAAAPKPAPAPKPVAAAAATPPTAAQQNAIRQSCRNDFMANCSGVQPGGKEALVCLQSNASKLSPACRQAVSAIGGAPKPAATAAAVAATPAVAAVEVPPAMPTPEQQAAIKNTCRADFMRNCRGVQPGGPEALMCLQANAAKLSPNCKTSVAAIADSIPSAGAAAATAAAATATPAAAPAKRQYLTPGIHPAVRVGRRIRERLEDNR